jgi:diacylglycerol kinase family enzyme
MRELVVLNARSESLAQLKSADISAQRRRLRVALDGESLMLRPPLHYRIRPRALRVIVAGPA